VADKLDDSAPFNDDQGTRISREPTGAGAEATEGTEGEPRGSSHEHQSGYGGKAGKPKTPNEAPRSKP
jgi:hypothetical protein